MAASCNITCEMLLLAISIVFGYAFCIACGAYLVYRRGGFRNDTDDSATELEKTTKTVTPRKPYVWGVWQKRCISDFAGTYCRERFVMESDGLIHHFVQYFGRPIEQSGPGSDMTEIDRERGVRTNDDMRAYAQRMGYNVQE